MMKNSTTSDIVRRKAESLSEYISVVESISQADPYWMWFRGQGSACYRLVPGVLRETTQVLDIFGRPISPGQIVNSGGGLMTGMSAERMLAAFKRQSRPFIDHRPENDFEWMFIAQHHGLPTRLLDWSTNALAALFFAVSEARSKAGNGEDACNAFINERDEFSEDGSAVFAMDPRQYNERAHGVYDAVDVAAYSEQWNAYLNPMAASSPNSVSNYPPLCVFAPHMTTRIRSQSGVFTLHGTNVWPIDYYDDFRPLITKIFIPYTATSRIMRSLKTVGITGSFIYPGLDTIAADVAAEERYRVQLSTQSSANTNTQRKTKRGSRSGKPPKGSHRGAGRQGALR